MRAAVDLHIHSALSSCAIDDMTPNNIVNMAHLKGLDIIAVTDHNSVYNCEAVIKCAMQRNIIAVPGMELETREEVHLICLFPGIFEAHRMHRIINDALPYIKNREDIFGRQLLMDENDNITGSIEQLLSTACDLDLEEAVSTVISLGGIVIPAHIDRSSYSLISNLGLIPANLKFNYLEVSKNCLLDEYLNKAPVNGSYKYIRSSDAHDLGSILERESFLELEEISVKGLIEALGRK